MTAQARWARHGILLCNIFVYCAANSILRSRIDFPHTAMTSSMSLDERPRLRRSGFDRPPAHGCSEAGAGLTASLALAAQESIEAVLAARRDS